jgi:hypothetical protein
MLKHMMQLMQKSFDIIFQRQEIVNLDQKAARMMITILNRAVTINTFSHKSSVKYLNLNFIAFEVCIAKPLYNVLTAPSRVVITACVE